MHVSSAPIGTMDDIVRIEKLENGFEVEVIDPKIAEENAKSNKGWQDPYKAYSFNTVEEVCDFLKEVLGKLAPASKDDAFASAFKKATKEG